MELSGELVQHNERGNGSCSSSSSLSCSILGDICKSEALEQPGDLDLPNVTCKEDSRRAGSFQSAFGSSSDKQMNNKVDSVTDDPKFEKPVKKKKKRKNKKKNSNKIFSETGQSKNDVSNTKASSRNEMGNSICSPSSSLSCSILGDIGTSEALEQPRDLDLPNVKFKEESRRAGSFQLAFYSFSDKQVNNKVDSVTHDPMFEKPVRETHTSESQTTTKVQYVKSSEIEMEYVKKLKDIQQLMVTDPLNAAYKMQLVSEGFELVTGFPLAEFERFLHSAAPVIASFYLHEKFAACLGEQLHNTSLCKHQIANTPLSTVWKWYEKPGYCGLKVKAGDSEDLKGLLDESTSFHAPFVPFLSAVQLFGYSYLSNSCGTSDVHANPAMHIRNSSTALEGKHFLAKDSMVKFDSVGEPVNSYMVFCSGGHSQSFNPPLLCSSNCELVFEFFETEIPPLRKPLHNKIVDLIDTKDSNLHVFGDPSKLKSLKLHELHPASWFSVAWYPIYRIPEGKFTATFLTYHSFGHLFQRHIPLDSVNKKTGCVVSPVVGLQSHNTKGEFWFDLKRPVESFFKESSPFSCSEILRDQLKLLKDNASLFAKGCVWKDGIKVFNRHPDYEFFCSRN